MGSSSRLNDLTRQTGVLSLSLLYFPPPNAGVFQSAENNSSISKNCQTDFRSSSHKVINQIPYSGKNYSRTFYYDSGGFQQHRHLKCHDWAYFLKKKSEAQLLASIYSLQFQQNHASIQLQLAISSLLVPTYLIFTSEKQNVTSYSSHLFFTVTWHQLQDINHAFEG